MYINRDQITKLWESHSMRDYCIILFVAINFGYTPQHVGPQFLDQGIKPSPPALKGGVLTIGLLGKPGSILQDSKHWK